MIGLLATLSLHRAVNDVALAAAPLVAGSGEAGQALADALAELRDQIDGLSDVPVRRSGTRRDPAGVGIEALPVPERLDVMGTGNESSSAAVPSQRSPMEPHGNE